LRTRTVFPYVHWSVLVHLFSQSLALSLIFTAPHEGTAWRQWIDDYLPADGHPSQC